MVQPAACDGTMAGFALSVQSKNCPGVFTLIAVLHLYILPVCGYAIEVTQISDCDDSVIYSYFDRTRCVYGHRKRDTQLLDLFWPPNVLVKSTCAALLKA